jgi:hypothetical protein
MTKVTLDLPIGEIVRILSPLSSEERGVLKPKFISIEEVLKLKGLIIGGWRCFDRFRVAQR